MDEKRGKIAKCFINRVLNCTVEGYFPGHTEGNSRRYGECRCHPAYPGAGSARRDGAPRKQPLTSTPHYSALDGCEMHMIKTYSYKHEQV